ncbi:MAG: hypothetical protein LBF25_00500 [Puniceicoccales bacterium]|jgi:hypothetical protein|nr:hypothetical protein [Puniceicoccales bacterium]
MAIVPLFFPNLPGVKTRKKRIEKKGKEERQRQEIEPISEKIFEQISKYFPKARGKSEVEERRVISGIVYVFPNGLRWKNTSSE